MFVKFVVTLGSDILTDSIFLLRPMKFWIQSYHIHNKTDLPLPLPARKHRQMILRNVGNVERIIPVNLIVAREAEITTTVATITTTTAEVVVETRF